MKKTRPIDFTKTISKRRSGLGILLIVLGVIAAGVLSFVVLLAKNDFDINKFFGTRAPEETTAEAESETPSEEGSSAQAFTDDNSVNFLLVCADDKKNVDFCDVISVSYAEKVIRVKPVSPELTLEYRGGAYTLAELFALSSAGAVRDALIERGIGISRYVSVNETNFKMIMQKLGAVDIFLQSDISFAVDAITYSYPAGTQKMTADTLLKYMKYADKGDALLSVQGQALAQVLRTHFTAENIDRGDEFFASLINLVDSDISAFDYANNRAELSDFLALHPPVNVID